MKKIWKYLNGNKTIICLTATAVIQQLLQQEIIQNSKGIEFTLWALGGLAAGSFVHHVSKGYLTDKKE